VARQRKRAYRRASLRVAAPPRPFKKLYRPLGYLVVTFADLEQMLGYALTELLHRPYREIVALESIVQSTASRIQWFHFLTAEATRKMAKDIPTNKSFYDSMQKRADKIYDDLFQANSDRNNLLHNSWNIIGVTTERSYGKDRFIVGKGALVEIPLRGITVKLLNDEARFFISMRLRVWDWILQFRHWHEPELWPAPLPRKYLLRSPLDSLIQANRQKARGGQPQSSQA